MGEHELREQAINIICTFFLVQRERWNRSLAGLGLGNVADVAIQLSMLTATRQVDRASDSIGPQPKVSGLVRKWTDGAYAWTVVRRQAIRLASGADGPLPPDDNAADADRVGMSDDVLGEPQTPDEVPAYLDHLDRLTVLRVAFATLVDRGTTRARGTFVSPAMWRTYSLVKALDAAGSDSPNVEAAEALGIKPDTVRQHRHRIKEALLVVRYTAGVLGQQGWLRSPGDMHRCLDLLDALASVPSGRLRAAATCVTTDARTGTRVRPPLYVERTVAADPTGSVDALHTHESDFAGATGSTQAHCVLVCPDHSIFPERTTEF